MKKVVVLMLLVLGTGVVSAQREQKRFTTGFNFGINRANALISDDATIVENGIGYRLGLISNLALTRRISLEPKAELSFNTSTVRDGAEEFSINPVDLELITHLRVDLKKCGITPYFIVGPNVRFPIGDRSLTLPTKQDVALDLGVGLNLPIGRIRIAPELRYSIGLTNISESSNIQDLRFHNISLILNFAGRPRF